MVYPGCQRYSSSNQSGLTTQIRTHPRPIQQGSVKCRCHVTVPAVPTQEAIPEEGRILKKPSLLDFVLVWSFCPSASCQRWLMATSYPWTWTKGQKMSLNLSLRKQEHQQKQFQKYIGYKLLRGSKFFFAAQVLIIFTLTLALDTSSSQTRLFVVFIVMFTWVFKVILSSF